MNHAWTASARSRSASGASDGFGTVLTRTTYSRRAWAAAAGWTSTSTLSLLVESLIVTATASITQATSRFAVTFWRLWQNAKAVYRRTSKERFTQYVVCRRAPTWG